jgi:hypothetical protein
MARSIALVVALALCACAPETDRDLYPVGHPGAVAFANQTGMPVSLAGCSHFDYEQRIDGDWVSQGPATVCVWEGFAQPVPPGETVSEAVDTSRPGTWRLRYPVGVGCSEAAPLDEAHCTAVVTVTSNVFTVEDAGCAIGGCSSQLCGEKAFIDRIATTCEWWPHYACYLEARCGRFGPGGACAWEQAPELLACLADPPQPGW